MSNYLSLTGRAREKAPKKALSASHKRAPKQERETARKYGGRVTPASGAKDMKGDVKVAKVLRIECKTTKNKSFSVTLDMIRKIEEAALSAGEMPAMIIEFNDGNGKPLCEVAVVPTYALEGLCLKS